MRLRRWLVSGLQTSSGARSLELGWGTPRWSWEGAGPAEPPHGSSPWRHSAGASSARPGPRPAHTCCGSQPQRDPGPRPVLARGYAVRAGSRSRDSPPRPLENRDSEGRRAGPGGSGDCRHGHPLRGPFDWRVRLPCGADRPERTRETSPAGADPAVLPAVVWGDPEEQRPGPGVRGAGLRTTAPHGSPELEAAPQIPRPAPRPRTVHLPATSCHAARPRHWPCNWP